MSLSDKIHRFNKVETDGIGAVGKFELIKTKDVKEFIRELKEELPMLPNTLKLIDKLAGEKLI